MSAPSIDVADQLECAICTDQLWEPKLLNCGHTFCLKCLDELFDESENPKNPVVACPLCRKKTPVPSAKGVAGLNSNFSLQSLLEALSPNKPNTLLLEAAKKEDGEAAICEMHKEVRKFYCSTCELLICRDCTVVDHPRPEHKCMNLDEAYTWRCQLNEKELQQATRVVKLAKRSKGILQSTEAILNQRCDQVISEIEKCREAGLEVLQSKTEAIETFQVDLEAEIMVLHNLSEDANKTDVLCHSKSLVESMTSLRDQQDEILDKPEQVQYPVFMGTSEDIQGWPKLLKLDGSGETKQSRPRKSRPSPRRQQSDGADSRPGERREWAFSAPPLMVQQGGFGCATEGRGDKGQKGRGGGYHHGRRGADNRGRGGADNRGRGGADNRGRGGYHGRGGNWGNRGEQSRGGWNQQ